MECKVLVAKIRTKLWHYLVNNTRHTWIYPFIYSSYWHLLFHNDQTIVNNSCYYAARPNPGAGIGHQLANWIAGYWYAQKFGLKFAHIPFSTQKWEDFLGFGEHEAKVKNLINEGFKTIKLPLFNEDNESEVELIKSIIRSYSGKKIVFIAEQDQGYRNQFGVMTDIRHKFNQTASRNDDKISYDHTHFNIAVHVRRTVIIGEKLILENDAARAMRWLSNDYYEKVLKQVLENIHVSKPIDIYLFSTGKAEEFAEFSKYGNVHFCSDMNEYSSFLHLVRADLLITSKSSFSYKPALLSDGIKISPRTFWHGYPETKNWILVENDGSFDVNRLKSIL